MANNENKKEKLFKEILRIERFEDRQIMDATKILTSDSTKLHIFSVEAANWQVKRKMYKAPQFMAFCILPRNRARSDVVGGSARQPDWPFGRLQSDGLTQCWDSLVELRSCTGEVILFFLNGETYLGRAAAGPFASSSITAGPPTSCWRPSASRLKKETYCAATAMQPTIPPTRRRRSRRGPAIYLSRAIIPLKLRNGVRLF
uniref:Uncharacterized protein n=1 Tax=Ananas comosus var. bracteatus TaxID=296719 RepID=A0A6V7QAF9_ANACO|nr:unnamed protein product [Ananas comosus var. bracteatus]